MTIDDLRVIIDETASPLMRETFHAALDVVEASQWLTYLDAAERYGLVAARNKFFDVLEAEGDR